MMNVLQIELRTPVLAAVALGLGAATPLAAQTRGCVTQANLSAGVVVDYADGISETYRSIGPGLLSVDGMDGTFQLYRLEIAQGTHLLNYVEFGDDGRPDESTRQLYSYGQPPASLPVPADGQRFSPNVTVQWQGSTREEFQSQAYVASEPLVLGNCTYQTIDAVIAYETDDNYIESIRYLPQIGLGYLEWSATDAGQAADNVVVGIRAASGK